MRFPKYLIPSWLRRDLIWSQHPNELTRPSSELIYWSIGAYGAAILVHLGNLPYWLNIIIAAGLVLRAVMEHYRIPLPSTLFTSLASVALASAVFIQYHTVLGRDPGTSLVAAFSLVKFFEMRIQRDLAFLVFCCYFMVTSALLYSQNFELFFYCLMLFWILTAVLLRAYCGDMAEHRIIVMLSRSGGLLLRSLPLTIFLFFFLPRFSGSLQLRFGDAQLGLTDTLNPGTFDDLMQDDSPAFRASIIGGRQPTVEQMYWRGLVLYSYNKNVWSVGTGPSGFKPGKSTYPENLRTKQQITVWPHYHNWLFCLDRFENSTSVGDNGIWLGNGLVLQTRYPLTVNHKMTYEVESVVDREKDQDDHFIPFPKVEVPPDPYMGFGREYFKALTSTGSAPIDPQVVALAHRLHGDTAEACARNIMKYFSSGFIYTTDTSSYGENEQYEFLLVRRMGYCEHYASAFALLMRLNKYPARVILGYFGGELNPYGFYIVTQSDAHAWDEYFNERRGMWVRCDPTSAIGRDNVRGDFANSQGGVMGSGGSHLTWKSFFTRNLPSWAQDWVQSIEWRRQLWDAEWDEWVLSFDSDTQNDMANSLDQTIGGNWALVIAAILSVIAGLWFFLVFRRRERPDPVEAIYDKFCSRLERAGRARLPSESPRLYGQRLAALYPEQAGPIEAICEQVSIARYHSSAPTDLLKKLSLAFKDFQENFRMVRDKNDKKNRAKAVLEKTQS